LTERTRQNYADAGRVREVEYRHHQAIAMLALKIGKAVLTPRGGDDAIATSEKALGHETPETRGCAGNEPCLAHDDSPFSLPDPVCRPSS
jgi:hypothetical protein